MAFCINNINKWEVTIDEEVFYLLINQFVANCIFFACDGHGGMSERYFDVWLAWMALWISVLICQIIGCSLAWLLRKKPPFAGWMTVLKKLKDKKWLMTLICGIFFSFIVGTAIEPVCGAWWLFAIFPAFILWIADWLIACIPKWRRKIASPEGIYWLSMLSANTIVGCLIHPKLFNSGLTWPIVRLFHIGGGVGSMAETSIWYSFKVKESLVDNLTTYSLWFLLPWALVSLILLIPKRKNKKGDLKLES